MEKTPFLAHSKYGVKIGALLLLIVGCGLTVGSLATLLGGLIWGNNAAASANSAGYMRFVQAMSSVGVFALPALLFSYLTTTNFFCYSKINQKIKIRAIIVVTWMAAAILPLIALLGYLNEQIQLPEFFGSLQQWLKSMELKANELLQMLTNDKRLSILPLNIIVLGILPGVCEEWLFRGTVQPLLQEKINNRHIVIWLTAFIFSAIHLQFAGFIPRLLLGAYLGYLAVWSSSLWLPILAHALHNTLSIVFNFFTVRQGIDADSLDPSFIPGFMPMVILSALFVAYGLWRVWRLR